MKALNLTSYFYRATNRLEVTNNIVLRLSSIKRYIWYDDPA